MEYRLHHRFSKFDRSVFLSQFLILLAFIWLDFLSRNCWSSSDHDLMASIWEKAGNLNSGRSYLITAVEIFFSILSDLLTDIFFNDIYVFSHFFQGRKRGEDLYDRVMSWSVFITLSMITVGISQVMVLKSFFSEKRPSQMYSYQ